MDPLDIEPHLRAVREHERKLQKHYYGDTVRVLFLVAGLILLIFGPAHPTLVPFNSFTVVLLVLGAVLLAGITNPRQRSVVIADTIIAAFGLVIFTALAVSQYRTVEGPTDTVFLIRQSLSVVFFFALYFSSKSLRAKFIEK